VLLRLVEAVDLIAEQDRATSRRLLPRARFLHDLADARDAFRDRAEVDERGVRPLGDDPRERRLAGPRRPPEDDAADRVLLDQFAQRLAWPEQVLLADVRVECARPHARG